MKRCPQCGREYDNTMSFCLDDGSELLYGPASMDEPKTAILNAAESPSEAATRAQIHVTEQTAVLPSGISGVPKKSFDKRLLFVPLALVVIILSGFFGYRYITPAKQINSIAVMPFENRNSDADTDYLSDGLAESLIYRLSQLPDLKVSPTSSVFRYKGKETDPQVVAKELGVDSMMTGRITQRGDNLTISVNLVDTRDGKSLWGEQYERKMSELLTTQREIVSEITNNLKLKLSGESEQKLAKKYTDNNEAYQFYLKGQFYFAKRTKNGMQEAIENFNQAIQLDPNFALAYAGVAQTYAMMPSYAYLAANDAMPKAKDAVQKALAIDPSLAEAHASLASILAIYDWNWQESEREFKRALELNQNIATTHYRYAIYVLVPTGRYDQATAEINRALELEPLSIAMSANLTGVFIYSRKFDEGLKQAKKSYDLDPGHPTANFFLSYAYVANGKYAEAIELNKKVLANDPTNQDALYTLGYSYAKSNQKLEAEEVITKFRDIGKSQFVMSYYIASIYVGLGEKNTAFPELEKAFTEREYFMPMLKGDPLMDPLRDDPRYKDLLKRMGLPD